MLGFKPFWKNIFWNQNFYGPKISVQTIYLGSKTSGEREGGGWHPPPLNI